MKNWEWRFNEKKYIIHWDSSDEEEDDPDQPEVYEEVIYEELSPEKEMEMKWMLIIQGVKEKPLKIEWSDGWEKKLNVLIPDEDNDDADLLTLWQHTSENIMSPN